MREGEGGLGADCRCSSASSPSVPGLSPPLSDLCRRQRHDAGPTRAVRPGSRTAVSNNSSVIRTCVVAVGTAEPAKGDTPRHHRQEQDWSPDPASRAFWWWPVSRQIGLFGSEPADCRQAYNGGIAEKRANSVSSKMGGSLYMCTSIPRPIYL